MRALHGIMTATAAGLSGLSAVAALAYEDPSPVQWQGYGELQLTHYDYPQNPLRDRYSTPHRDSRVTIDLSKVSLSGSKMITRDWRAGFELVILHQGIAGTDTPNNGGPFNEDHAGGTSQGALQLNHAYLAYDYSPRLQLVAGRIPVAVGQLSLADGPGNYLASRAFEAELSLLPEDWSELGASVRWTTAGGDLTSTTQLINGLDSSGFNSQNFVGNGVQGRFGFARITEPAVVERLDFAFGKSIATGVSYYFGETSQNRPTPDMVLSCQKRNDHVAPCGYEHAPLTLADWHASLQTPTWQGHVLLLWGSLEKAGTINRLNLANTTNLPDVYSPVAAKAYGLSGELGYNLRAERQGELLAPFVRFDRYNTVFEGAAPGDQKPLYDRRIFAAGLSWRDASGIYAKGDISHRRFGRRNLSYENTTTFATGLLF